MAPDLVAAFASEFTAEINRITAETEKTFKAYRSELSTVDRKMTGIIAAIEDGMYTPTMKARMQKLEQRKVELEEHVRQPAPSVVRIHPNLCKL